jgi:transposase
VRDIDTVLVVDGLKALDPSGRLEKRPHFCSAVNDVKGHVIGQMMRVGLYRPVHVKTLRSQKLRMLLTHRKLLVSKAIAIENDLRGTLRNFGLKVGMVGKVNFEARIRSLSRTCPI